MHSTASDGTLAPAAVVERAARAGLAAMALTDHDTVQGLAEAVAAGERLGVRVVPGCEFSVLAPWGEMHLLGYFLPVGDAGLEAYLARCRDLRVSRARAMVSRLNGLGVAITDAAVAAEAGGGAVGRPHVARALHRLGLVGTVQEAFDRWLARGRPAFVEKALPAFAEVAEQVHAWGGVVAAAHLKEHLRRRPLERLKAAGLDAVEVRHPGHPPELRVLAADLAQALDLAPTGGSDWHGDAADGYAHGALGSQEVPDAWLDGLEARRPGRLATGGR